MAFEVRDPLGPDAVPETHVGQCDGCDGPLDEGEVGYCESCRVYWNPSFGESD